MAEETKLISRYLTISNNRGLVGTFSSLGAGVKSLTLDGEPLILELSDPSAFLCSPQFFGKTLGRVAGRIKSRLKMEDEVYRLLGDEEGICLHGGIMESLSFREFSATVENDNGAPKIIFEYHSPDLECGFPGNLTVRVIYSMPLNSDDLLITFEAESDKDTPVSLSNHIYWNIFRSENVDNYTLKVNASKYGAFKKGTQLINRTVNVPKYLDFRNPSLLKDKLDMIKIDIPEIGTLDHCFLFDNVDGNNPQVILDTPKLTLETFTDYGAVNFYVDSSMTDVEFTNLPGLKRRRAIAIEPQMYPLSDLILRGGRHYNHFIRYHIIKK
ncbi:MAG: hypothetical protein WCS80_03895 [Bacilli bacterium]